MKNLFNSILFLSIGLGSFAQTGPGGVGNTSTNSLWLDALNVLKVDGENVDVFPDVSGNSNNLIQISSVKQPVYKTSIVNGMPVVRFDGVNDDLLSNAIPALESANVTYFIVYKQGTPKNCGVMGSNYTSNIKKWQTYTSSTGFVVNAQYSPSINYIKYTDDYSQFNIMSSHITPTQIKTYKEGALIQTKSATYTTPSGHNFVVVGSYPSQNTNNKYLDGDVAEVIVFNSALNNLERVIVENYLSSKYNRAVPQDFYSFDGVHKYNVKGIGNDATNSHIDSKGYGVLSVSNPAALNSNEYMFIGHDNNSLTTLITSDIPATISTYSRLSRTWRVDETGELGNVTITYDLSGEAGFADPSTYTLLIDTDADGDFSNANTVVGTYNAGSNSVDFTANINTGDIITLSGLKIDPQAIHSVQSGNWFTTSTWDCGCIPSYRDTVYVEPTHTVSVDADAVIHDLNVTSNGILAMTQNFDLSIKGNFTINGSLNFVDGQLVLDSDIGQTLDGGAGSHDFNNILLDNSSTSNVTLTNGEFILNNLLTPNNGSVVIDNAGGGSFIVNSTSANTSGRIGLVTPTCTITGNVTVRRFLPSGPSDERTISSPVIGANLSEWDANIYISGIGFPDGCAWSDSGCYYSCRTYVGGDFASDYIDVTNPNEPLVNGRGYELFIGTDLNNFNGATITSTGQIRDYQDYKIQYPTVKQGWNIVGNPYASPILFSKTVASHIGNYFYVYDATSESYQWYDGASNTSSTSELANGLLAIGQGFWVYAGGTPDMTFTQDMKAVTGSATFIRKQEIDESLYLTLTKENSTQKNVVSIGFDEELTDGYDNLRDVLTFIPENQKSSLLYIEADNNKLAKNYLKDDQRNKIVNLNINVKNEGYFSVEASNIDNNTLYEYITLIDKETNQTIDLRKYPHYSFYTEEGEFERFTVILSNEKIVGDDVSPLSNVTDDEITISQIGNAVNVQSNEVVEGNSDLTIYNLLGQELIFSTIFEIQKGSNLVVVPEELSGIYIVVVKSANGMTTKKMMF